MCRPSCAADFTRIQYSGGLLFFHSCSWMFDGIQNRIQGQPNPDKARRTLSGRGTGIKFQRTSKGNLRRPVVSPYLAAYSVFRCIRVRLPVRGLQRSAQTKGPRFSEKHNVVWHSLSPIAKDTHAPKYIYSLKISKF